MAFLLTACKKEYPVVCLTIGYIVAVKELLVASVLLVRWLFLEGMVIY